jgi:hypothetical protein
MSRSETVRLDDIRVRPHAEGSLQLSQRETAELFCILRYSNQHRRISRPHSYVGENIYASSNVVFMRPLNS